jgi:hypothetical protein
MSGTFPATPEASTVNITSLQPNLMSETRSGRRQVRSIGSQRWSMTATFNPMTRAEFMPVYAFVLAQKGQLDTFQFVPPVVGSTEGGATGTVTTNGTFAIGATSITIAGLTGTLKAGDFIKFASHSKVYMLTADRSGAGAMTIEPPLFVAVGNTVGITYVSVPFTVRLTNDIQQYRLQGFERYTYEIDMVEAL